MDLKKHFKEFAERLYLLDDGADDQLSTELIELHEVKCSKCQEDRLSCTVRPACKDRNFLNMLIELGVEPQNLPSFCYSQYLEQIRRFILEKKGRGMVDRRIPIKDLLSTLRVSSIRQFTTRFSKIWTKTTSAKSNNVKLVAGDELRFHFDFARGVVILNPVHQIIKDYEVFELYVSLLSDFYELTSQVTDVTLDWWVVEFTFEDVTPAKAKRRLQERISERFESLNIRESETGVEVQVEVITDGVGDPIEVGDIQKLFRLLSRLKQSDTEE